MSLKKITLAITAAASLSTPLAHAETDEVVPMAYFKIPFSSEGRDMFEAPSMGFAMQYADYDRVNGFQIRDDIPAFFDMSFTEGQMEKFSFNGVNALQHDVRMMANGSTETTSSIHWGYVAGGVVLGAVVINELDDDDNEESAPVGGGGAGF